MEGESHGILLFVKTQLNICLFLSRFELHLKSGELVCITNFMERNCGFWEIYGNGIR